MIEDILKALKQGQPLSPEFQQQLGEMPGFEPYIDPNLSGSAPQAVASPPAAVPSAPPSSAGPAQVRPAPTSGNGLGIIGTVLSAVPGPVGNIGKMLLQQGAKSRAQATQEQTLNRNVQFLIQNGVAPDQAALAARDPRVMTQFLQSKMAPPKDNRPTQVRAYEYAMNQRRTAGETNLPNFGDWVRSNKKAGATSIDLGSKGDQKFFETAGKKHATALEKATDDLKLIPTITFAEKQLDNGALTGEFATLWTKAYSIGNAMGWNTPEMNKALAASQGFDSQTGVLVGSIIKLFGAGTGLSDADREYAKGIAGGDRRMTKAGLQRILQVAKYRAWEQAEETRKRLTRAYGERAALMMPEPTPAPPKPADYGPGAGPGWLKNEGGGGSAPATGPKPSMQSIIEKYGKPPQ